MVQKQKPLNLSDVEGLLIHCYNCEKRGALEQQISSDFLTNIKKNIKPRHSNSKTRRNRRHKKKRSLKKQSIVKKKSLQK